MEGGRSETERGGSETEVRWEGTGVLVLALRTWTEEGVWSDWAAFSRHSTCGGRGAKHVVSEGESVWNQPADMRR